MLERLLHCVQGLVLNSPYHLLFTASPRLMPCYSSFLQMSSHLKSFSLPVHLLLPFPFVSTTDCFVLLLFVLLICYLECIFPSTSQKIEGGTIQTHAEKIFLVSWCHERVTGFSSRRVNHLYLEVAHMPPAIR